MYIHVHIITGNYDPLLSQSISSMLYTLTHVYPKDANIISTPLDLSPNEHLYIRVSLLLIIIIELVNY